MDKRYMRSGVAVCVSLLILAMLAFPHIMALADGPVPSTRASLTAQDVLPPSVDLLIIPSVVRLHPEDVPPNLTREQARNYAYKLAHDRLRPLLDVLEQLQAKKQIVDFQVQSGLHAVVAHGATKYARDTLARQKEIATILPASKEPPACTTAAIQALSRQVLDFSRQAAHVSRQPQSGALSPQSTAPSVWVYAPTGYDYTGVGGKTTPETLVTMRVLRSNQVIVSKSTTSSSGGYYYFWPDWRDCPSSGYEWTLQTGDVVEVTAHGSTVSTVVAHLSAWVDPTTNVVAGITDAGRSVEIHLSSYSDKPCSSTSYTATVGTDSNGNFSADFSSQVNFDRNTGSGVYARDANGNATLAWPYAYQLMVNASHDSDFEGYLKPTVDFTATLHRDSSIVDTDTGKSDADGFFYGWFSDPIQPGEAVHVVGGGVSIQYTVVPLTITLDSATDRVIGTTGPNRRVVAYFHKRSGTRTSDYINTSCTWHYACASTTSNISGTFALTTGLNLVRGDYVYVDIFDDEGNEQYTGRIPVTAIVAYLGSPSVQGYWGNLNSNHVNIILKDRTGTVKGTRKGYVDSWDQSFSQWMGSIVSPTDIIEVGDGTVTETMTVQNLTARLHGSTGHLTGSAYNGYLGSRLEDFRRGNQDLPNYCSETTVSGNTYDLTFGGAQVGGQDYADVWSTGPNGHYTRRTVHAFTVNATMVSDKVWGRSETANVPITVTVQRSGNPTSVTTATVSSGDYYTAYLGIDVAKGDTVSVETSDGNHASVPIPSLTVYSDGANNRVYGKSPAGEPVHAIVIRHKLYDRTDQVGQIVTADPLGNYSANFAGLYWGSDCSAVSVDQRCTQAALNYYNAAGHRAYLAGPAPQPVGPDSYEEDDSPATATAYAGIQFHTFDRVTDTDWISFTVSAEDVNARTVYRIETVDLGFDMDTVLYLYDSDGNTELAYDDDGGVGRASRIDWTPSSEGTYYVRVTPYNDRYAAYCDATYNLLIMVVRSQIFLPSVLRSD